MYRFIAFAALVLCAAAAVATYSRDAAADGGLSVRLDCDTTTAGVQDQCVFASGLTTASVAVVLQNDSAAAHSIGSFNVDIAVDRRSVLNPSAAPCDDQTAALDCNPDFNDAQFPPSFSCNPPLPVADLAPGSEATASRLACYGNGTGGPSIAPGASLVLGTVSYTAGDGLTALRLESVSVADVAGIEIGSCAPVVVIGATCAGASVQIGTPTVTPTPTATPVLTNPPTGGRPYGIFLDCDPLAPGIQSTCNLGAGPVTFDVDVYIVNNTAVVDVFTMGADIRATNAPGFQFNGFVCHAGDKAGLVGDQNPSTEAIAIYPACIQSPTLLTVPASSMVRVATVQFTGGGGSLALSLYDGDMYFFPSQDPGSVSSSCLSELFIYCAGAQVSLTTPPPTSIPTSAVTATASPTPVETCMNTSGEPTCALRVAIDCDLNRNGVQADCAVAARPTTIAVGLVLENVGSLTLHLGTFDARIVSDETLLQPVSGPFPDEFNANPDFALSSSADWACSPPAPRPDQDPSPLIARSLISCYNGIGTGPLVRPAESLLLARIYYHLGSQVPGDTILTSPGINVYDTGFSEQYSCYDYAGHFCPIATLHLGTDNCPGAADPDQTNTNDEILLLPKPVPVWDDDTNPAGDYEGDVCDPDIDGDGLVNTDEDLYGTSPTAWDSDGDRRSDGFEVRCGSHPMLAASVPHGADADLDALPDFCEPQYGTTVGVRDTDGDGLRDGLETGYWLTDPTRPNTDNDDCSDGREVATVNGDRTVNSGDLAIIASGYGHVSPLFRPYDQTGDGIINSGDLGFAASKFGTCSTSP